MAKLLYFGDLVDRLGRASEEVEFPSEVTTVESLLAWLRRRGGDWEQALQADAVRVTVNKQFSVVASPVKNQDEIALVPTRPV
jgi:molybdopterin synthase sulfur carrier subunit